MERPDPAVTARPVGLNLRRAPSAVAQAWRSAQQSLRPSWIEAAIVAGLLVAVQVVAFAGYYRGVTSPGGDFLSTYNTEAFAWWRDGGIVDPPSWMPYTWGGFPAAAQVQNSSWYLLTGLVAWMTPFDIRAASVLQALHVAIAGLGVYVLARRGGSGRTAAAVGLVAYSFVTGFFTEAPYVDIVRGFALVPWILLCLSPLWPWRRWWSTAAAAVLLWQAAVGIYPGVLVATGYVAAVWVVGWQLVRRPSPRQFLVPLAYASLIAVSLTLAKFLPQVGLLNIGRTSLADLSVLNPTTLATVLLPGFPDMLGVYSLNLLFVPAAAVVLALLCALRRHITRIALVAFAAALVLALPVGAFRTITSVLPAIDASRFRLNDHFPVLAVLGVLAAVAGVERLHERATERVRRPSTPALVLVAAAPLAAASAALVLGSFRRGDWQGTYVALCLTTAAVVLALVLPRRLMQPRTWRITVSAALATLAAVSGLAHASTVRNLWAVDTVMNQEYLWGATSGDLIEHRISLDGPQRPPRTQMDDPVTSAEYGSTEYNSVFYTGGLSMGGYFSVKNSASYITAGQALTDPVRGPDAKTFWEAAGILVGSVDGTLPSTESTERCAASGACGDVEMTPLAYSGDRLLYGISAERDTTVLANEAFYTGWEVLLVGDGGRTIRAVPHLGSVGEVAFFVPAGDWRVSMVYRTPLSGEVRLALAIGVTGLLAPGVVYFLRRRRTPSAPDRSTTGVVR